MSDLDILKQLLNGNHLSKEELSRAKDLLHQLSVEANHRVF